ncbi:hypothetical protein [Leptospira sanjuanensis]|uniref:hypothetical protein n=1 Tax=Leptospira sanjuanensis TaxID=2879643 RepID=UPI001EE864FA|nr:hypothetical protein [Leptospira sanjuanensis]MCG6170272.1 hypothetical protein [Leptospira sanjuanensis]
MKTSKLVYKVGGKYLVSNAVVFVKKLIRLSLIVLLLAQAGCVKPSDKSAGDDHSVILSLIGFTLMTVQQGPCGKYVTVSSSPQNLNFVPYVNSGVNFSGAIVYMPNVRTNNKLLLCSNANVNFYQSANFVMRSDNNCTAGITNTPKVNNVLGANTLIGSCYSYPIQIDGSFTLSVFIEGNGFPEDAKVYLQ